MPEAPPDAMQVFLKEFTKLEGLDLKKIFEEHQPKPISEELFKDLSPEKLTAHLRQHCQWLSWSHMPNQASIQLQKIAVTYHLIVGHLGDRGGSAPVYPSLHELGTNMDTLSGHLHDKEIKESKEAMQKVKQSYTKLHAVLEKHDIKPDNQKDPLIALSKKMMTPLLLLGTIPTFALLGTASKEIPKMSKEFISASQKFRGLMDARLASYEQHKMVPKSKVYQSKIEKLESLKTSIPKEKQDAVTHHIEEIHKSTAVVQQSKSDQDFLPGAKGDKALKNIHTHLEGLDKEMSPAKMDGAAKPIDDIGKTVDGLGTHPEATPKLLTQSSKLHEDIAKGFTATSGSKKPPLMGDAVAMIAPFYLLQSKIPTIMQRLSKHAAVAENLAHTGEIKIPKAVGATVGKTSIPLTAESKQALKKLSEHMRSTSHHMQQAHKKMVAHDEPAKANLALAKKSKELQKYNTFRQHQNTIDKTQKALIAKKKQMLKSPVFKKAVKPVESKLSDLKVKAIKTQAGSFSKHTAALDGHINKLSKHMQGDLGKVKTLLPALKHLQSAKSFMALAAGTVIAPMVMAMGGDAKAAIKAQVNSQLGSFSALAKVAAKGAKK
ncbi:MAG: hypothetical protein K0U29_02105 [Gammaproteobacteria bacterium]|nr:hypothetical protein [Gammaproteobacteria bacterium]MCH9743703.1 hypothetical protein [Gammaproteobacteria bacterium]